MKLWLDSATQVVANSGSAAERKYATSPSRPGEVVIPTSGSCSSATVDQLGPQPDEPGVVSNPSLKRHTGGALDVGIALLETDDDVLIVSEEVIVDMSLESTLLLERTDDVLGVSLEVKTLEMVLGAVVEGMLEYELELVRVAEETVLDTTEDELKETVETVDDATEEEDEALDRLEEGSCELVEMTLDVALEVIEEVVTGLLDSEELELNAVLLLLGSKDVVTEVLDKNELELYSEEALLIGSEEVMLRML